MIVVSLFSEARTQDLFKEHQNQKEEHRITRQGSQEQQTATCQFHMLSKDAREGTALSRSHTGHTRMHFQVLKDSLSSAQLARLRCNFTAVDDLDRLRTQTHWVQHEDWYTQQRRRVKAHALVWAACPQHPPLQSRHPCLIRLRLRTNSRMKTSCRTQARVGGENT
jgi:hypothetical protein